MCQCLELKAIDWCGMGIQTFLQSWNELQMETMLKNNYAFSIVVWKVCKISLV